MLAAQAVAAKAKKPFFITEYNNGLGKTSRDDASAAAFVFRVMGMVQQLDLFSWWTFSDVFEEGWMRSAPFHNGYGLMTVQGTRKPAWRYLHPFSRALTFVTLVLHEMAFDFVVSFPSLSPCVAITLTLVL